MKMRSIILIFILCLFGVIQTAQAVPVTVTLDAVKDCEVKAFAPDTAFPSDPNMRSLKTSVIANNTHCYAQYQLPPDCTGASITSVTFKLTLAAAASPTTSCNIYNALIKEGYDPADMDTLTYTTAPGIKRTGTLGTTINIDTTQAINGGAIVYTGNVVGTPYSYTILPSTASIGTAFYAQLATDVNRKLTIYYHERYPKDPPNYPARWATLEHPGFGTPLVQKPPQLEITYEPTAAAAKEVLVNTTLTGTAMEEGPVAATYNVSLSALPDGDVTVTLSWNSELVGVSPSVLTFTATDWNTPQTVTVTPVDDYIFRGTDIKNFIATITHTPGSVADSEYNALPAVDAEITVEDNDAVTVTLTAVKDVQIYKMFPDTAFPNEPNMYSAKLDPNDHAAFLWEFKFPVDCDPATIVKATYKNTISVPRTTGTAAVYFAVIRDDYEGDLNTYTWNNAPGISDAQGAATSVEINTTEAAVAGYVGYAASNTKGTVLSYSPLGNTTYWDNGLKGVGFDADTNGRIQILWHERYFRIGSSVASREHPTYNAPQLEIIYPPQLVQEGIMIDDSSTINAKEEGQVATTYDVTLSAQPTANVTVTLGYDADVVAGVSPSVLTFTNSDWNTPQTVTVTPVDDAIAYEPIFQTQITHTATSTDVDYAFAPIVSTTISIEDNDYKTEVLTAIADNDVNSVFPDQSGSARLNLAPMRSDNPVDYRYSYIQFEMPADFAYALGGTKFKMTRSYISPAPQFLYLLGVRNSNLTTGELIPEGDVNAYTWNTAPGLELVPNPASAGNLSGYLTDEGVFIANALPSASGSPGDALYMATATIPEPLRNFINNHIGNDNKITLFIIARTLQTDVDQFASLENGTYSGPQIELVYGATPYCGQPGTAIADADIDEDCDVDIDDLQAMAGVWLNDTVQ